MRTIYDLVVKGGTVVNAEGAFRADVGIRGEQIAAVGVELRGERELDADGKLVVPGAVDIHVHLQMPLGEMVSADDFDTGTAAAALGGTTTIVDFVEPQTNDSLLDALQARKAEARQSWIDYGFHMTLGPNEIHKLHQVPGVYEAGCSSFKLYMAYDFCLTDAQMMLALEAVRDVGGVAVIHAENWDVIQQLTKRNLANGIRSPVAHPASRPAIMEGEAVARVIAIAAMVGTPIHILHVTCQAAVQNIAAARAAGLPVTGETCPQYLFLTDDVYRRPGVDGALNICAPPIRDLASQNALWDAVANGSLDLVATDHCPFLREQKARYLSDYSRIPGGVPSIESRFALMYSEGVLRNRITHTQWISLCCTTPARIARLRKKGTLNIGYDADIVIFNPHDRRRISSETLHENVDWTPYEGLEIQGWPQTTISRGRIVVQDGQLIGTRGQGRFISRR